MFFILLFDSILYQSLFYWLLWLKLLFLIDNLLFCFKNGTNYYIGQFQITIKFFLFLPELLVIDGFFLIQQPLLIAQCLFINDNLLKIVTKCPFGFILVFVVDTTIDCLGILVFLFISINCCDILFVVYIRPRLVNFFLYFCGSQFFTFINIFLLIQISVFCIFFLTL